MAALRTQLLKLSLPLVTTHGFTRETLARSVLYLPTPHAQPLRESAVSALFGDGDDARRTLVGAWLDEGRVHMHRSPTVNMKDVLSTRLQYNEPVLSLLPEAFSVMASPSSGFHLVDPVPALKHAVQVANEACMVSRDQTVGTMWYARRGSLAAIYAAAELHQLVSPETAYSFLSDLLYASSKVKNSLDEVGLFAEYVGKSWAGIIKSRGIL